MTTPRDLSIIAVDAGAGRAVEPGDLSLALAGAEVIDLLAAGVLVLDGDRLVPGERRPPADRLLSEAAASLVRQEPYESVEDWLWRRGRGLSEVYQGVLVSEGDLVRRRRRWVPVRSGRPEPAGSPAGRHAAGRWASGEPVLAALAAAAGIRDRAAGGEGAPGITDEAVLTVLAAVNEAVVELESVRQRRTVEKAAFDNIWRGA
ncbi:GPP34 family phosphoprotein [Streptomyces albofaciens JCM 4342]|uniref:GPP34 family phosphoprotein n=1 Tax=Streptomyces albofaciens TaxID=66866 RepID=UPI00123888F0|nr:GPP34 family phosphoprotein [Streptomyces albofaciens]KAA6223881.1 GPP34 family phosphoprotein [Streptomyces albofaciens JCM 4342]